MTQKDYIKIAEVLRETKSTRDKLTLVSEFSLMLKADNPRFNATIFYKEVFDFEALSPTKEANPFFDV